MRPGRDVVKGLVLELGAAFHHALQQSKLALASRQHKGMAGLEALPVNVQRFIEQVEFNLVLSEHVHQHPGPLRVSVIADDPGVEAGLAGALGHDVKIVFLILDQIIAQRMGATQCGQRCTQLIADAAFEGHGPDRALHFGAVDPGLLKQDADDAVDVRVRRSFANIEIIEAVLGVDRLTRLVHGFGMVSPELAVHLQRFSGQQGVLSLRHAGLEKVSGGASRLMLIRQHVGQPPVQFCHPGPGFGMNQGQPVAVEIKQVMVGAVLGPVFVVDTVVAVGHRVLAAIGV